jgi:hypothetical protein
MGVLRMTGRNLRFAALFLVYAAFTSPAYAYLDPATGSIAIQVIIGAVATWVMYSKLYAAKAKNFLQRLVKREGSQESE